MALGKEELTKRFSYHPPKDESVANKHARVRALVHSLAAVLDDELPDSREKSIVMTHLEEAMMWANAAIARNES